MHKNEILLHINLTLSALISDRGVVEGVLTFSLKTRDSGCNPRNHKQVFKWKKKQ